MTHKQGRESCIRVYAPEVINYTCIYFRDQLQCFQVLDLPLYKTSISHFIYRSFLHPVLKESIIQVLPFLKLCNFNRQHLIESDQSLPFYFHTLRQRYESMMKFVYIYIKLPFGSYLYLHKEVVLAILKQYTISSKILIFSLSICVFKESILNMIYLFGQKMQQT